MNTIFFGLPGCGKTTIATMIAVQESKKIQFGYSIYKRIYGNFDLKNVPFYTRISFSDLGRYSISDAIVLIDEATLEADNRDFKSFSHAHKEFVLLSRHYRLSIYWFVQQWDAIDRKIRAVTDRVFYVYKPFILGHWFSRFVRVPYKILFPDKKDSGEQAGQIIQGYIKPPFFFRLLARFCYRPSYYPFFDSWERPKLPPLPPPDFNKINLYPDIVIPDRPSLPSHKEKSFSLFV